jgi:hypothetical protein
VPPAGWRFGHFLTIDGKTVQEENHDRPPPAGGEFMWSFHNHFSSRLFIPTFHPDFSSRLFILTLLFLGAFFREQVAA